MKTAFAIHSTLVVALCTLVIAACSKGDTTPGADTPATSAVAPATDTAGHDPAAHGEAPAQTPATSPTAGAPKIDPANVAASLVWDAASKTAKLPMVAGVGSTGGGWNFDGHASGTLIFTVPVGSKVEMPFYNDDIVPHSLGVVNGSPTNVPSAPSAPVFPGAITIKFEQGLMTNEKDLVQFTASKAGTYLIVCGVAGHAASGMWVVFVVSASARAASVRTTG
jgi:sulfocyanin